MRAKHKNRVVIAGYSERVRGGVSTVTNQLIKESDGAFSNHPVLFGYRSAFGEKFKSILAIGRLLFRSVADRPKATIIIIGSKGDIGRSLLMAWPLKLLGQKIALHFHKELQIIMPRNPIFIKIISAAWKPSSFYVFLSESLARQAIDHYNIEPKKVHVIPNGLDSSQLMADYTPLKKRINDAIFIGRWSPEKGVDDLIKAFSESALGSKISCSVYGADRPDDGSTSASNLKFFGWRSPAEIRSALASSRILVLPSFAEAYPTVLLEAAAAGTPFVATRVAGIPDIAEQSGGGLIVPPGDSQALERSIQHLLTDANEWRSRSLMAYRWAQTQSVRRSLEKWLELLCQSGVDLKETVQKTASKRSSKNRDPSL